MSLFRPNAVQVLRENKITTAELRGYPNRRHALTFDLEMTDAIRDRATREFDRQATTNNAVIVLDEHPDLLVQRVKNAVSAAAEAMPPPVIPPLPIRDQTLEAALRDEAARQQAGAATLDNLLANLQTLGGVEMPMTVTKGSTVLEGQRVLFTRDGDKLVISLADLSLAVDVPSLRAYNRTQQKETPS